MTDQAFPRFVPVGDCGLLVEFGDRVDAATHDAVLALDRALADSPVPGQTEVIPAYVNLMVVFDPVVTDHDSLRRSVAARLSAPGPARTAGRSHVVPVCYDGAFGRDLDGVALAAGLSPEAVIAAHLSGDYTVNLYGFAPGYAYLAGVPDPIRLPRKAAPVRGVAAGSVIVAGPQCIVTTLTMPTGWWILGRSPLRILTGDPARPFLFDVGDRVRFRRIGQADYDRLARADGGLPDGDRA